MAAIVHNVVGLLHGTNAIYNARLDEAPMLVLGATGPMDIEKRRAWIDWIHTAIVQGNVARDFGLFGVGPIEKPSELRPALEEAIRVVRDKKQAALVDVVTYPHR